MTIEVTEQHIKKGNAGSCGSCPIALALKDAGFKHPVVDHSSFCYIMVGGGIKKLSLPYNAIDFIVRFDSGKKVHPFSFELET